MSFKYIHDFGIEAAANYPYVGKDQNCNYDASKVVAKATSTVQVTSNSV